MSNVKTSNVSTAKAAYHAFNTGDVATMQETWADNVHWWNSDEVQPGGERSGADEVMQLIMELPQHWSGAEIEAREFIDAGDYVIVLGTQHFTNDKGSADARFAHVLKFDSNGKCVDAEMHTDTAKAAKLQS